MSQVSQFTYISNSAAPLPEDKSSSVRMNLMMSELRYRTAVPIFFRRNGKAPFRFQLFEVCQTDSEHFGGFRLVDQLRQHCWNRLAVLRQVSQLRDHLPFLRDAQHSGFGQRCSSFAIKLTVVPLILTSFQTSLIQILPLKRLSPQTQAEKAGVLEFVFIVSIQKNKHLTSKNTQNKATHKGQPKTKHKKRTP